MLKPIEAFVQGQLDRLGERGGERLIGVALTLVIEFLMVLVVLSLGMAHESAKRRESNLVSMAISGQPKKPQPQPRAANRSLQRPLLVQPPEHTPAPPAFAIIPLSRNDMASFDLARLPRLPGPDKPFMGPADPGVFGDSKRVGTAPNGQPMYAASWYREPSDSELRGYLSTADGPGWALITCRTVPDFRVEDCVGLDEYPMGSNMLRAVLAAAWQFRVRPPQVGGVSQVGDWVRIRIEYTEGPRR